MDNKFLYGSIVPSWIFTIVQSNEVFQIISLVCSIVSSLVLTIYTIYKWYKKASADGKITDEEIEDLEKDLKDNERK